MIHFWAIFIFLVLLTNLDWLKSHEQSKMVFAVFIGILLAFFAGLRGNIDNDWENYQTTFYIVSADVKKGIYAYNYFVEPLYIFFNQVAATLHLGFQSVLLFTASLAVCFNLINFWRYSQYFFFAVLFYFIHTYLLKEMLQIRAGLACSILLFTIPYIEKKRFVPFFLIVITAGLIHTVSWAFLIVFLVGYFVYSTKNYWFVLIACLLVGQFFPLGNLLFSIGDADVLALQKVAGYTGDQNYNYALGVFKNPVVLKQLFFILIALFNYDSLKEKIPYFRTIFNLYFLSICWLSVFNDFSIMAARIATAFSIVEPILVTALMYVLQPKIKYHLSFVIFIWLIAFAIIYLNLYKQNFIQPYHIFAAS